MILFVETISDELRRALAPSHWLDARRADPEAYNVKDPYSKASRFNLPTAPGVVEELNDKGLKSHFGSIIGGRYNSIISENAVFKIAGFLYIFSFSF